MRDAESPHMFYHDFRASENRQPSAGMKFVIALCERAYARLGNLSMHNGKHTLAATWRHAHGKNGEIRRNHAMHVKQNCAIRERY